MGFRSNIGNIDNSNWSINQNTEYNNIKIQILNDKMAECVEIEDYEMAAEMRDKIKELKNKI